VLIPVKVDYSCEFAASDYQAWEKEYNQNIEVEHLTGFSSGRRNDNVDDVTDDYCLPQNFVDDFESMEPAERQFVLDELAGRPDLWDDESGVMF